MATTSAPAAWPRTSWPRPKHLLFSFIAVMMGYVLVHNESFLVHRTDPVWQHFEPFKWWLLPHGLAGACTILLGPMQFSDRLRQRFTRLHRVVGRIYVFGALVAAPFGAYIQWFQERMGETRSFTVATVVDAILLMSTTGIAFYFAWKRKIPQHRAWMTRSFACALIFIEVRAVGGLTGWDNDPRMTETIVWSCVGLSLLWADIALQLQESWRARASVARTKAAAPQVKLATS